MYNFIKVARRGQDFLPGKSANGWESTIFDEVRKMASVNVAGLGLCALSLGFFSDAFFGKNKQTRKKLSCKGF